MTRPTGSARPPGGEAAGLTIGELAAATGVGAATLRMWEQRHGFPEASRLPSGHRRYREDDVVAVRAVLRVRERGVSLERAIESVAAAGGLHGVRRPGPPSVFAALREGGHELVPHRLRKRTLSALSRAIEDEFCAGAHGGRVFGGFQTERFLRHSLPRWREIARVAESAVVFAERDAAPAETDPLVVVPLGPDAPARREWFVVSESPAFPVALSAWELPGQEDVADGSRVFETVWSLQPEAVRQATACCVGLALDQGTELAPPLAAEQLAEASVAAASVFLRAVAYVDR